MIRHAKMKPGDKKLQGNSRTDLHIFMAYSLSSRDFWMQYKTMKKNRCRDDMGRHEKVAWICVTHVKGSVDCWVKVCSKIIMDL